MVNPFDEETGQFLVLVNAEGQYSLWPGFREVPRGWAATGPRGTRQVCLDWIEAHWTDMRPRSLAEETSVSNR
jgi:MbtH protein